MTTSRRWLLASLAAMVLVAGCATHQPVDPNDAGTSLVFGYFDAKDAPSSIDWVSIKRYGGAPAYYQLGTKNGLFWHVAVEPGSYQVEKFGGVKRVLIFGNDVEYNYGTRGRNETAIRIVTPGVYFMGAHRYIAHDGGLFAADKFEMQAVKSPSEKELLTRLVAELEADKELRIYTRQIGLAKKRLAELSR
jgi:hypothetical protein